MGKIRDYHRKNYGNPFFNRTKKFSSRKKSFFSNRGKMALSFLIILLGGGFYFIFFSTYFEIKNIDVLGNERIGSDELKNIIIAEMGERRFVFFDKKNIFIFDEHVAGKKIDENFVLNSWEIVKFLPGTITINIKEKKPAVIWRTGDKYYLVDWDGVAIQEIDEIYANILTEHKDDQTEAGMTMIIDESAISVDPREKILSKETIGNIFDLRNIINNSLGLSIAIFKISGQNEFLIKGLTDEGWEVYFSTTSDMEAQAERLKIFIKENSTREQRDGLQYVDVRFADRVYYK